jgi:hypothetical protein
LINLAGNKTKQKASDSIKAAGGTDVMPTMALAKSWSNRSKQEKGKLMIGTDITKLVCGIAAGVMLATPKAKADFVFDLSTGNGALTQGGYSGPYASVDVHLIDSTHATVTFTSDTQVINGKTYIYLLGDGGSVGVNVNGTATVSGITGANGGTGFTQVVPNGKQQFTDAGAGNQSAFGQFSNTIDTFDGYGHSSDTISFELTAATGTTWSSANDVLKANANGAFAEGHIFVTTSPADASNGALVTGYAANGGAVPEPTTMIAGALLLLPFGMSTLKIVRSKKTA